jgi:hypothetical protein
MLMALTETRGKRTPYLVKVLLPAPKQTSKPKAEDNPAPAVPEKVSAGAMELMNAVAVCDTIDALLTLLGSDHTRRQLSYLKDKYPQVHASVASVMSETRTKLEGPTREPGED